MGKTLEQARQEFEDMIKIQNEVYDLVACFYDRVFDDGEAFVHLQAALYTARNIRESFFEHTSQDIIEQVQSEYTGD